MASNYSFIGGPETSLPSIVESFLSWSLSSICLLIAAYNYYVPLYIIPLIAKITNSSHSPSPCSFSLTTHSPNEVNRMAPLQRYNQLMRMLQYRGFHFNEAASSDGEQRKALVFILRTDNICRHLASLAMRPIPSDNSKISKSLLDVEPRLALAHELAAVWPQLLELPPPPPVPKRNAEANINKEGKGIMFDLTVVIPAYSETGTMLERQILHLLRSCVKPERIEILVVDAGEKDVVENELLKVVKKFQNEQTTKTTNRNIAKEQNVMFGCVRWLEFKQGGGRGPCLNYGAAAARGRILTFCHLDSVLPPLWDEKIEKALHTKESAYRVNASAFYIEIDTSPEGLLNGPRAKSGQAYYPPGIRAVDTSINIRTRLFSLPYGDQGISIFKNAFDFVGGFPDQCLMEDYDFIHFLRQRQAFLKVSTKESISIIPGPPAVCSARRWQKFGATYVTCMNYKIVTIHNGSIGPDELYKQYYGRAPPERESELSPWEVEMQNLLKQKE